MGRSIDIRGHAGRRKKDLAKYQNPKSRRCSGEVRVTKFDPNEKPEPLSIERTDGMNAVETENQRTQDILDRKLKLYAKKKARRKGGHKSVPTGVTYTAEEVAALGGVAHKKRSIKKSGEKSA